MGYIVSDQQQNPRLVQACTRLDKAISRLEAALKAKVPGNGVGNGALTEELAALRDENAALKQTNDTVSCRLDGAIDRLRGILD